MRVKISGLDKDHLASTASWILIECVDAYAIASPDILGDTIEVNLMGGTADDLRQLREKGYKVKQVR